MHNKSFRRRCLLQHILSYEDYLRPLNFTYNSNVTLEILIHWTVNYIPKLLHLDNYIFLYIYIYIYIYI